ncbi:MAG TPA: hypothetical protein DEB40_04200 [Elusimicrobia bacterium]|nr:hypothetical protein [Elusimicrobiota bacterium]HBT60927.1 hypothetical protein [Elusimicrobiota bacterium]
MSKKDADTPLPTPKPIEEMILDCQHDKYSAIPLAAVWAKELRRREENRHLTANEILELALREVLGGTVDWKSVKKNLSAAAGGAAAASVGAEAKKPKE